MPTPEEVIAEATAKAFAHPAVYIDQMKALNEQFTAFDMSQVQLFNKHMDELNLVRMQNVGSASIQDLIRKQREESLEYAKQHVQRVREIVGESPVAGGTGHGEEPVADSGPGDRSEQPA